MPSRLAWNTEQLKSAMSAAEVGLWRWNVDTDEIALDQLARDMWGQAKKKHVTFEELSSHIHPEDSSRVRNAFAATRRTLGTFEIDFRIQLENEIRWISSRGQGNDEGIAEKIMFGVFLDVTQRKQAEEANQLLAEEMTHRVKNLLQIAAGLALLSGRSAKTTKDMVSDLSDRLIGLGRAHDLVRPTAGGETKTALLGDLFSVLLSPYEGGEYEKHRVRISMPRLGVGEQAVTALALVIHELATNSLKYGALSGSDGTLDVSAVTHAGEAELAILWVERGGPKVVAPPAKSGFGSKMVQRALSTSLGGSIAFEWPEEGLIVTLRIDETCLGK
jgi:two-component sensor histidine kinase